MGAKLAIALLPRELNTKKAAHWIAPLSLWGERLLLYLDLNLNTTGELELHQGVDGLSC